MKVAIYARVSTEDQTTENQVRELEDWIKRRGWEIVNIMPEESEMRFCLVFNHLKDKHGLKIPLLFCEQL